MINSGNKFGFARKRSRPDEPKEAEAWDAFENAVESEIQIILNTCASKYYIRNKVV